MAGSGKRADQKKPSFWKDKKQFGKHGFTSRSRTPKTSPITIKTLDDRADSLLKKGLAKTDGEQVVIDLADIGRNKLLSTGNPKRKYIIVTEYATEKAAEKIKKAGGDVKVQSPKKSGKAKNGTSSAEKEKETGNQKTGHEKTVNEDAGEDKGAEKTEAKDL